MATMPLPSDTRKCRREVPANKNRQGIGHRLPSPPPRRHIHIEDVLRKLPRGHEAPLCPHHVLSRHSSKSVAPNCTYRFVACRLQSQRPCISRIPAHRSVVRILVALGEKNLQCPIKFNGHAPTHADENVGAIQSPNASGARRAPAGEWDTALARGSVSSFTKKGAVRSCAWRPDLGGIERGTPL